LDGGSSRLKASTYTQNNTNRINVHNTDIHALSGIRTHDPGAKTVHALDPAATVSGVFIYLFVLILPVALYGAETWSLTIRKYHRLRVFEKRVLRSIF
jgi:hypothetical protein